jgi:hypothetical protein
VADALGQIAHAFQLAGDVHGGDQPPQIPGDRLLPRNRRQAGIL